MAEQSRRFEAEVQELLELVVHSLYSNRDIFLRELIANAADAIDKARFLAVTDPGQAREWEIRIEPDKERGQLTITDNGVGMTRDEVVADIGTIARSGTRAFLDALRQGGGAAGPELIGQFGVGFYSAFMVADKVELVTRKAGTDAPATRWESDGKAEYTLADDDFVGTGTRLVLHLKPDCASYLEPWKIREIVARYSDFIAHPIRLRTPSQEAGAAGGDAWTTINSQKAIWMRPAEEVTDEEHESFYRQISHVMGKPLRRIHFKAEGATEFRALLYLPDAAPMTLFTPEEGRRGLHLYVRRVFICDDSPDLLPGYLRFVKGVVEADDLPLNVSREMLQENPAVRKIQKNLVRKILAELKQMLDEAPEDYRAFFREFGPALKEGMHTDHGAQEKLRDLLLYETMKGTPGEPQTLAAYVDAMPAEQPCIYCLVGESRRQCENSPHLELLREKGYDVIFMTDPVDEWVIPALREYRGKTLAPVGVGEVALDEATRQARREKAEAAAKDLKELLDFLRKALVEKVSDVRISQRLTDSACCLVGAAGDPGPHMERLLKAMRHEVPERKRILEINPDHVLVGALNACLGRDRHDPRLPDSAEMLYDQALLAEGGDIPDPLRFAQRIATLMAGSLGGHEPGGVA
jgi:molecular chaperone HtpG